MGPPKKRRTQDEQREGRPPYEFLPWGRIAAFLSLPELLTCRLVSKSICSLLRDGVLPRDCARWLEKSLKSHNLMIVPCTSSENNIDSAWREATNDLSKHGFSFPFAQMKDNASKTASAFQPPLDCLLKCLRVCKYLPREAAVVYSARHGRQIVPVRSFPAGNDAPLVRIEYDSCTRGEDCATCRFEIPRKPRVYQLSGPPSRIISSFSVDEAVQICVNEHETVVLDRYFTTCVSNLPSDLICPLCCVDDRRTIVLTEMTYRASKSSSRQVDSSTDQLSFDPAPLGRTTDTISSEAGDDESQPNTSSFPPTVDCFFTPTEFIPEPMSGASKQHTYKHALAIHCTACRQFGILGPAGLCCDFQLHPSRRRRGQERRAPRCRGVQVASCIAPMETIGIPGGYLNRWSCATKGCNSAIPCAWCRSGNDTPYCQQCRVMHEALLFHA